MYGESTYSQLEITDIANGDAFRHESSLDWVVFNSLRKIDWSEEECESTLLLNRLALLVGI